MGNLKKAILYVLAMSPVNNTKFIHDACCYDKYLIVVSPCGLSKIEIECYRLCSLSNLRNSFDAVAILGV